LKDRSTLGTLFLVPRAQTNDAGQITDITENAKNLSIGQNGIIEQVLNQITFALGNETAVDFFEDQGIDLGKFERVVGIGDLEFQMYVGYGDRWDEWFADFMLGIRLPTGRKDKDPGRVYFLSTGHNRHFELNAGLEGGWMCCDWFALKMDGTVSHAFKKDEKRAAQFEGATIRNIGPTVEADVSWTYFVGHFDLNFFHPANNEIGAMLGYELFLRSKDRIKFEQETATFAGITGNLDAEALEVRTNSMAHKMRLEVWNRWNLFEIIAGASTVFAGRSVMKETEAHITFNVYF
jgi:hypothetical protein